MTPHLQMLRFAVYDWDSGEVTDDTKGQDNLGTMECSLAEIVKQGGKRVRQARQLDQPLASITAQLLSILATELRSEK